jgi:hypothetical protein
VSEYVKICRHVGTGQRVSRVDIYEYPREEWEAMSNEEQEKILNQLAIEYLHERCECGAWVEEE